MSEKAREQKALGATAQPRQAGRARIEMGRKTNRASLAWLLLVAVAAVAPEASAQREENAAMTLKLTSTAFAHGGAIPTKHTCEGQDASPPLAWSGVPAGAKTLVLIVDDPDAPDPAAPQTTWVHWVLYNIPAGVTALPEAVRKLPAGTREGMNDWKRAGYRGPCPPIGEHRYFHKLYALDTVLPDLGRPSKVEIESRIKGHVVAQAELIGTYRKRR